MLEILVFLFQNFSKTSLGILVNAQTLSIELEQVGCDPKQVQQAFAWLKIVSEKLRRNKLSPGKSRAMRIYTEEECRRFSVESRGLLYFLEEQEIIDPILREFIIERALALDTFNIGLEQMKWIITIIILNSQAQKTLWQWLETKKDGIGSETAEEHYHNG